MKFRFQYIYTLFMLSFGILTALSVLFYNKLMDFTRSSNEVERNYETMFLLSEVDSYLQEAVNSEHAFLFTRDSTTLTPFFDNQATLNQLLDSTKRLVNSATPPNTSQQVNLIRLRTQINNIILDARITINKVATGAPEMEIHRQVLQEKVKLADYKLLRLQMQNTEARERVERDSENQNDERNTPHFLYATFIFAAGSLVVSFFFIIRELKKRLEFQQQLQQQVGVLNRANTELEQLNHIASHHLQEPLRKIQTFANRIATRHHELPEEVNMLLEKIDASAKHMHGLTRDMVKYSNLINTQDAPMSVDLNHVLLKVAKLIDERLTLSQGQLVITNTLPVIKGHPSQLVMLFEQLIDNSIKFCRKEVPPVITITYEAVKGSKLGNKIKAAFGETMYYEISVADNGMGFDNKYVDKMFYLFQKLESQPSYQSKGIGLPMVQRIMVNHGGTVAAMGTAGEGAIFRLYFPIPNY
jgi:signal transduction histidine kinase